MSQLITKMVDYSDTSTTLKKIWFRFLRGLIAFTIILTVPAVSFCHLTPVFGCNNYVCLLAFTIGSLGELAE